MGEHVVKHGDGVKDISFSVEDLHAIMERAKQRGCKVVDDIWEETDENGTVISKLRWLGLRNQIQLSDSKSDFIIIV